ncbi:PKD domain-containing protein [Candidatus Bipolaricaulota bacterium]|nr:PKD domain-containing protein [Candidatus Bipolaricaulota bacterium]
MSASSCVRRTIAALLVVGCAVILGGCFNSNQSPIAAFSTTIDGLPVTFDADPSHDPDGSIATYHWEFGDGGWANTATATHTYETSTARSYTVSLSVTDNDGASDMTSSSVQVTPPAAPVTPVNPTPTPPDNPQPTPPQSGINVIITASESEIDILSHEIDTSGWIWTLTGRARNVSGRELGTVFIHARILDSSNVVLDSSSDMLSDITAGATFEFELWIGEDERIETIEIYEISTYSF